MSSLLLCEHGGMRMRWDTPGITGRLLSGGLARYWRFAETVWRHIMLIVNRQRPVLARKRENVLVLMVERGLAH